MKKFQVFLNCLLASLGLGLIASANDAHGIDAKPGSSLTGTNAVPPEPPAPLSVFDFTPSSKDPFFPNSTRRRAQTAATNVSTTISASQFVLKGISGVLGQEVVIINNRNLAEGEHGDVTLPSGAIVGIRVVKIDHYSVTILPDGQRETLIISLPKDDQ